MYTLHLYNVICQLYLIKKNSPFFSPIVAFYFAANLWLATLSPI